jgi:putative flavoprotein involved in K+ transport
VFDDQGRPVHQRGVTASPGLYFLGLPWLYTRGSALLGWVKDDAAHLAEHIHAAHKTRPHPHPARAATRAAHRTGEPA